MAAAQIDIFKRVVSSSSFLLWSPEVIYSFFFVIYALRVWALRSVLNIGCCSENEQRRTYLKKLILRSQNIFDIPFLVANLFVYGFVQCLC